MRPAKELLEEFVALGGRVSWKGGKPAIVGSIPDALILEIRDNRETFLDAWDAWDGTERAARGYGQVPGPMGDSPLRRTAPQWPAIEYRRMDQWVRMQPDAVVSWVLRRAEQYQVRSPDWSPRDRMQSAMADLWDWQTSGTGDARPGGVMLVLDESVEGQL